MHPNSLRRSRVKSNHHECLFQAHWFIAQQAQRSGRYAIPADAFIPVTSIEKIVVTKAAGGYVQSLSATPLKHRNSTIWGIAIPLRPLICSFQIFLYTYKVVNAGSAALILALQLLTIDPTVP